MQRNFGLTDQALILAFAAMMPGSMPVMAQTVTTAPQAPAITYADLADLADSAPMVLRAQVRKLTRVEDSRARGLRRGHGRFYVEARTRALLAGGSGIGEALTYLVDLPLDANSKPPKIKKADVLLFAHPVAGRPGELQLVAPDAQVPWSAQTEASLRGILTELLAPDSQTRVTGVREMIHVPGNLSGSGETQIFLATRSGDAASITVRHEPGREPVWGVSFSELVADMGRPPQPMTIAWYRLACFLPDALPSKVNLSETARGRQQALADYRFVLGQLGPCARNRS